MADLPFDLPEAPNVLPTGNDIARLRGEWDGFIANPQGRAALLSMGLQLLQPIGVGQSPAGAFGQAIGAGGTSVRQSETLDLAQRKQETSEFEAGSKAELRSAGAYLAEERARNAERSAGDRAANLDLRKTAVEATNERNRLTNMIRAQGQYQAEVAAINKRNNDIIRDPSAPKEPIPSFSEWLAAKGPAAALLGVTPNEASLPTTPPGGSTALASPSVPPTAGGTTQVPVPPAYKASPDGLVAYRDGARWVKRGQFMVRE